MRMHYTRWPTQKPLARIAWEQGVLPLATVRDRLDLLRALAFARPLLARCPVVLTIYDMSFVRMGERFPFWQRYYLRVVTRYSARHAARITVISQSSKDDVVAYCGVPGDKVHVVYCGADEQFSPRSREQVEQFRAARGLPEHFILYLGTLEPRKNVSQLLRAYATLHRNGSDKPKLVIAGAKGWGYADVFAAVEQSGATGDVIFAGYVPQAELPLWYNAADLFVFPSLYEGFGLPVLEAMACGTPSITSNVSSLPEVAGDAGLLVDPHSTAEIRDALDRLLLSPSLRAQLAAKSPTQARRFTWDICAKKSWAFFERLCA